jgi:hypothetical protein
MLTKQYTDAITLTEDAIARSALQAASRFLREAIKEVNAQMGDGAADRHPQIVAAFMHVVTNDYTGTLLAQQVRVGLESVATSITEG